MKILLIPTLTLMFPIVHQLWSRDITLAFLQTTDILKIVIYARKHEREDVLHRILAFSSLILKYVKSQNEHPEYSRYWGQAFQARHFSDLAMRSSALDPCT